MLIPFVNPAEGNVLWLCNTIANKTHLSSNHVLPSSCPKLPRLTWRCSAHDKGLTTGYQPTLSSTRWSPTTVAPTAPATTTTTLSRSSSPTCTPSAGLGRNGTDPRHWRWCTPSVCGWITCSGVTYVYQSVCWRHWRWCTPSVCGWITCSGVTYVFHSACWRHWRWCAPLFCGWITCSVTYIFCVGVTEYVHAIGQWLDHM